MSEKFRGPEQRPNSILDTLFPLDECQAPTTHTEDMKHWGDTGYLPDGAYVRAMNEAHEEWDEDLESVTVV